MYEYSHHFGMIRNYPTGSRLVFVVEKTNEKSLSTSLHFAIIRSARGAHCGEGAYLASDMVRKRTTTRLAKQQLMVQQTSVEYTRSSHHAVYTTASLDPIA